jgi:hypothetical protein
VTSGVKVTTRGPQAQIDVAAMLDFLVAAAIGMVQRRTAKGIDLDGRPFPGYSEAYAEKLRAMGESTKVDLTVTGAYLAGISERSRVIDANGNARATIGPGTGTSESVAPPAKGRARAVRTGKRSPSHAVLARYLSRKFPHLGLTADERARLAKQAMRIALKQQGGR